MRYHGVFDKLLAILQRDLLTAARYRKAFILLAVGNVTEVAAFYYLAKAIGPGFHPDGLGYYPFLLVGTGLFGFLVTGVSAFVSAVHDAQVTGTMEVLLSTSTPAPLVMMLSAFSAFVGRAVHLVGYLLLGLLLFRISVKGANLPACILILSLFLGLATAIGMIAATVQVLIQKGGVVVWLMASVGSLLTGTMFPVSSLPGPLQKMAAWIPVTPALNAFRSALFGGAGSAHLSWQIVNLAIFTAVLLPASILLFSRGLRHARLQGTLSFY